KQTVDNIPRENSGGARTAAKSYRHSHDIPTNNGRKKQCSEKSPEIALRAGGKIELRSGGVHHHPPLQNSKGVRAQVHHQNDHESNRRNAGQRRAQRVYGKKVKKDRESSKRCYPAKKCDPARARFLLRPAHSDHLMAVILVATHVLGIMNGQVPEVARIAVCAAKISSIFSASTKSTSLMPFALWVTRSKATLF